MKINWKKSGTTLEGHVGAVLCFYLIKENKLFELVCDLPEATPGDVGRHVIKFHSPKQALTYADQLLTNWTKRFEQ